MLQCYTGVFDIGLLICVTVNVLIDISDYRYPYLTV